MKGTRIDPKYGYPKGKRSEFLLFDWADVFRAQEGTRDECQCKVTEPNSILFQRLATFHNAKT